MHCGEVHQLADTSHGSNDNGELCQTIIMESDTSEEDSLQGTRMQSRKAVVGVFCRSASCWILGQVVRPLRPKRTTVEFMHGGMRLRKHLQPHSKSLLQGPRDLTPNELEAFAILHDHVTARFDMGNLRPVTEVFRFVPVRNNAFAIVDPLNVDCEIEYHGPFEDDILLKVYVLSESLFQNAFDQYILQGYIHAMQKPRAAVQCKAANMLGLVVHSNLNRGWLWRLKEEEPNRYDEFICRSASCGFQGRGDALAETSASDADYLISFTSGNKEDYISGNMALGSRSHKAHGSLSTVTLQR